MTTLRHYQLGNYHNKFSCARVNVDKIRWMILGFKHEIQKISLFRVL
jgi:hypothetical protein